MHAEARMELPGQQQQLVDTNPQSAQPMLWQALTNLKTMQLTSQFRDPLRKASGFGTRLRT
jgi:hypothetical protein